LLVKEQVCIIEREGWSKDCHTLVKMLSERQQ